MASYGYTATTWHQFDSISKVVVLYYYDRMFSHVQCDGHFLSSVQFISGRGAWREARCSDKAWHSSAWVIRTWVQAKFSFCGHYESLSLLNTHSFNPDSTQVFHWLIHWFTFFIAPWNFLFCTFVYYPKKEGVWMFEIVLPVLPGEAVWTDQNSTVFHNLRDSL